jgi:hypothetical protein
MAAASSSICVVLALALAIPPPADEPVARGPTRLAPVDLGDPPELVPPMSPAVMTAQRHAVSGRYVEAAIAYEAAAGGDPRMLYQAGVARSRAGQNALAVRRFQAFLERSGALAEAARRHVDGRIASSAARTVRVTIAAVEAGGGALPPDRLASAQLRIEPVAAGSGPDPGSVITLANYRGEEVVLDPVPVVVHLAVPGYLPVSQLRTAGAGPGAWEIPIARQKVPVELRFTPERALRKARLRVAPNDGANVPAVEQTIQAPTTTVMLTTGGWQIDVTARRHSAQVPIQVTPGMRSVAVDLARTRRGGGRELNDNDVLLAALGVGFFATAATGLGLLLAGGIKENRARRRNEDAAMDALLGSVDADAEDTALATLEDSYPTASLHRDIDRAYDLQLAGGAVVVAATGALITALFAGARLKRRVLLVEMAAGALIAGGGGALTWHALRRQADLLAPVAPEERATWSDLRSLAGPRVGAALLVGLGAGLVVFPLIALVGDAAHERRKRRRGLSLSPTFGRGSAGVAVSGQF